MLLAIHKEAMNFAGWEQPEYGVNLSIKYLLRELAQLVGKGIGNQ